MPSFYEIEFSCDVKSKKNMYAQTRDGRRFKPKSIVETEQLALSQIPPECWGLNLKHPAVETWMYWPKKSWAQDQDGAYTTILDWLVLSETIAEDNLRNFNGIKLHHPAVESDRKKFVIRLYPGGELPYGKFES